MDQDHDQDSNSSDHSGDEHDETMKIEATSEIKSLVAPATNGSDDAAAGGSGAAAGGGTATSAAPSSAANKKDPSRPKRKKARRACYACQRAHLTCGDERPCQRCVKRGLAEQCQDGARKKAKYLHDAPPEALLPGYRPPKDQSINDASAQNPRVSGNPESAVPTVISAAAAAAAPAQYANNQPSAGHMYATHAPAMPSQVTETQYQDPAYNPYSATAASISSQYSGHGQQRSPMPHNLSGLSNGGPGSAGGAAPGSSGSHGFNPAAFDQADPNVFGFDLAAMNFGNQYGAIELAMLGHMSGAHERSSQRPGSQRHPSNYDGSAMDSSSGTFSNTPDGYAFRNDSWPQGAGPAHRSGLGVHHYDDHADPFRRHSYVGPNAYAIGAGGGPGSLSGQSPVSSSAPDAMQVDGPTATVPGAGNGNGNANSGSNSGTFITPAHGGYNRHNYPHSEPAHRRSVSIEDGTYGRDINPSASISQKLSKIRSQPAQQQVKRRRNPATIYSSVVKAYPYTVAFHALAEVLQRRFSPAKRLKIAQALAKIRPSFISCARTLVEEDLVFMEKCFLRGLLDYEDFSSACGTPTIVCRRTGEVAHVGKEFTLLTGWSRDVLLGFKQNMNANGDSGAASKSSTVLSTPRPGFASTAAIPDTPNGNGATPSSRDKLGDPSDPTDDHDDKDAPVAGPAPPPGMPRYQPVFLAELLDDDSVVQFYEDYSNLAFADSKGSAWSPCKLLKYRTRHEMDKDGSGEGGDKDREDRAERKRRKAAAAAAVNGDRRPSSKVAPGPMIHAEEAMQKMGDREGKVECVYCWMVKRDVFNIPMMIVINFLPVIN